ncbi:DUF3656 domain-containing U32 family peptidase, partial [Leptospira borgpetersenii]|uniref:DUF3656 domain-containing U32 family peptidase n=1 Tax=Leptospira borgpetersenii TaxID=174 RepID=UPI0027D31A4B
LCLMMTSADSVSVTHTLDGQLDEANNREKALTSLQEGLAKLGQTIYFARDVQVTLPTTERV